MYSPSVLFDVRTAPFTSWQLFAILGVVALATVVAALRRRSVATGTRPYERTIRQVIAVVCVGVFLFNVYAYKQTKTEFVRALETRSTSVIVGVVSDYTVPSEIGKSIESFRIGNREFNYAAAGSTPAYHARRDRGGVLRDGMRVRIYDYRGNILRIERLPDTTATERAP